MRVFWSSEIQRAEITDDIANAAVFLASDAASFTDRTLPSMAVSFPFAKSGREESVEFRAEIARRGVRTQNEPL